MERIQERRLMREWERERDRGRSKQKAMNIWDDGLNESKSTTKLSVTNVLPDFKN